MQVRNQIELQSFFNFSMQQVLKDQDDQVDEIGDIVKRLKNNSKLINNELDNQTMYSYLF